MEQLIIKTKESRALVAEIGKALKERGSVKVTGLGVFLVRQSPEHKGRNPQNGEAITIPATKKIKVRLSSVLKRAIL